ncbi:unnamed protein product [Prorocentrum cordatum]|uniref:3-beta hydroxysteroid dehydrogenase/isomerase domain-containing protein n=1 Tax=Prorocentrum cordatum TaxID=2364126 RepID=A0ABN9Y9Q8_9DINO|nr:unnamed protein product [Polarella glacialis]
MQACVVGCNLIWISSLSCLESSRQLLGVRPIHLSTMIVLLWSTFLGHPALGKFYIATDGDTHPHPEGYCVFWEHIDSVITDMGFKPIRGKCHLPAWLMMFVGWLCQTVGGWFGLKPKLTCFSVRMLLMNRWFRISAIERDLGYRPVIGFREGWADTVCWFREHWLPHFGSGASGLTGGVAKQTQHKIDLQSGTCL